MNEAGGPWWWGSAAAVVAALAAAAGKVWAEQRRELRELRAELAAANLRIVELQRSGSSEHQRDLRRMAGISTSIDPPRPPPRKPRQS